jgi:hypothetical protein
LKKFVVLKKKVEDLSVGENFLVLAFQPTVEKKSVLSGTMAPSVFDLLHNGRSFTEFWAEWAEASNP